MSIHVENKPEQEISTTDVVIWLQWKYDHSFQTMLRKRQWLQRLYEPCLLIYRGHLEEISKFSFSRKGDASPPTSRGCSCARGMQPRLGRKRWTFSRRCPRQAARWRAVRGGSWQSCGHKNTLFDRTVRKNWHLFWVRKRTMYKQMGGGSDIIGY